MGEYLSTPNKEKKSEEGENGKVINLMSSKEIFTGQVWSFRNVRMAQRHGGCAHFKLRYWGWRCIIWCL